MLTSAAKWRAWREGSAGRRILLALLTVSGMTALIKLLGAAKAIVIARNFGVGDELDSYLIAFLIPSFFADTVAGATSSALIPAFIRAREAEGHHSADKLLGSVLFFAVEIEKWLVRRGWNYRPRDARREPGGAVARSMVV